MHHGELGEEQAQVFVPQQRVRARHGEALDQGDIGRAPQAEQQARIAGEGDVQGDSGFARKRLEDYPAAEPLDFFGGNVGETGDHGHFVGGSTRGC